MFSVCVIGEALTVLDRHDTECVQLRQVVNFLESRSVKFLLNIT